MITFFVCGLLYDNFIINLTRYKHMSRQLTVHRFLVSGIPTFLGLGIAWLGVNLIRNEARLLIREVELKEALKEKNWARRQKLLSGN